MDYPELGEKNKTEQNRTKNPVCQVTTSIINDNFINCSDTFIGAWSLVST